MTPDGVLSPELFELDELPVSPSHDAIGAHPFDAEPTVEALEADYLRFLMSRYSGARQEVARVAGIGRSTLWRKLKEMGEG